MLTDEEQYVYRFLQDIILEALKDMSSVVKPLSTNSLVHSSSSSNDHKLTLPLGSSDLVILSTHPPPTILQHSRAVLRASSIPAASGVIKK